MIDQGSFRRARIAACSAFVLVTAAAAVASGQCETGKLTPPDAAADGFFGCRLAADGEWLAVSASAFDGSGTVWMLRRQPAGGFAFAQELEAPPGGDHFGYQLELDGTTLAVGAPVDGPLPPDPGAVHIYELVGERWEHVVRLQPVTDPPHSGFGRVLALDGRTLAVGAWNENVDIGAPGPPYAQSAGRVHLYRFGPSGWTTDGQITAPDPQNLDWFGYAVDVAEDVLAIGFPRDDDQGSDWGSVRIHRRTGPGAWTADEVLVPALGSLGGEFGNGLVLDGDRLAVASPRGQLGGVEVGLLDVFDAISGVYTHVQTLDFGQPVTTTAFHDALALDGDRLAAGARNYTTFDPADGAVFLVDGLGSGATSVSLVKQKDTGQGHWFGMDVLLEGDELVAAAPGDGTFGDAAGAVQTLSLSGVGCQSLFSATGTVSLTAGVAQSLALWPPPELVGLPYLLLGSLSGTAPGIPIDGLVLPLALDAYTLHTLTYPNQPPLKWSFGLLQASGGAIAQFLPPPGTNPALAGVLVHHAYVAIDLVAGQVVHVSNAIPTLVVD